MIILNCLKWHTVTLSLKVSVWPFNTNRNPDNATALHGWEPEGGELALLSGLDGWQYSLLISLPSDVSDITVL